MEFCSLFSSSSGNCFFIKNNHTRILCDAGKSGKRIEQALRGLGEEAKKLNAIIITHEHNDHINAAGVLSRRYDIPLYANLATWEAMLAQNRIGKIKPENQRVFIPHKKFSFADLEILPFNTSHDAAAPVGFRITDGHSDLGIATDTGIVTPDMLKFLPGCRSVVLESNHDLELLEYGPYPERLKRRIRGTRGHLSNDTAAELAVDLVECGTERIILAHLSQENNIPILAHETTANVLKKNKIQTERDVLLEVADRTYPGRLHKVK